MYKGRTKKFRDTIHGYIEIPEIIVAKIIDTEQFQRLRCIEQTSMRSLYPAARHDRFIHSLGVYRLGVQAFENFRKNAQIIMEKDGKNILDNKWWTKQGILFSIACLMHDCSHAPFSHTLEDMYTLRKTFVPKNNWYGMERGQTIVELDAQLLEKCRQDTAFCEDFIIKDTGEPSVKGIGAPHEKMSSYCVMNEYQDIIKDVCRQLLQENMPGEKIENDEITDEDVVFIVRMIIGCQYQERGLEKSIKNCLVSMLNSSSIDVDGLDYVVRDAYMSGIDNFSIDYQRLLGSFTIIRVDVFEKQEIKNQKIDGIWLKGSEFDVSRINAGEISGSLAIQVADEADLNNIHGRDCSITKTKKVAKTEKNHKIEIKDVRESVMRLEESCEFQRCTMSGKIQHGKKVVSALHPSTIAGGEREYILGYEKNCLSIIQSTVEARNHEYLWVYTHPKVLYSSHYLQWELLRDSTKYLCCCLHNKNFSKNKLTFECEHCEFCKGNANKYKGLEEDLLLYIMGYSTFFEKDSVKMILTKTVQKKLKKKGFNFYRTCDDDLNALFKRVYIENKERDGLQSEKIHADFSEFFSRKHRRPLWKSFVEYENFLKMCNESDRTKDVIPRLCKGVVNGDSIYNSKYAVPSEKQQEIFLRYGYENVIIIKASVKTKELNPYETFIEFKNQSLRLCDLFKKETRKEKISQDFYYIFADIKQEISHEKMLEMVEELGQLEL